MTDDELAGSLWEAIAFYSTVSLFGKWGAESFDRQVGGRPGAPFLVRSYRKTLPTDTWGPTYSDDANATRLRLGLLVSTADRAVVTAPLGSPPARRRLARVDGAWTSELSL
jgi:hypothetical protein